MLTYQLLYLIAKKLDALKGNAKFVQEAKALAAQIRDFARYF